MNEDLRSATKELKARRQEAQSMTEELAAVSGEARRMMQEVGATNRDLHNLMVSMSSRRRAALVSGPHAALSDARRAHCRCGAHLH